MNSVEVTVQPAHAVEPVLSIRDVVVRFGGIVALDRITFDIQPGQIVGLIGPNGAGKTTLFNCLSRFYTPNSGDIRFSGRSILDLPPHRMAGIGIGRTFQNLALFRSLSVFDNVRIGCHTRSRSDYLSDSCCLPWALRGERAVKEAADEIIRYLHLGDVASRPVGDLPFGTQKRVELARALATQPKLLLLDEPANGLNHEEVSELGETIRGIRNDCKLTLLLVEHHMGLIMSISDKVVVLNFGHRIAEGTPLEIQGNPEVIAAYLGSEAG